MAKSKVKLESTASPAENENVTNQAAGAETPVSIAKPSAFSLEKFKSKRAPTIAGVETLQTALPICAIKDAGDWVRLHPDEEMYWSDEFCFVTVPIKGQKQDLLHLISEEIAMKYLPAARIKRFKLALAAKPHDVFFLAPIPTQNLDNAWNDTHLIGCEKAKTNWTQVTSRKSEGVEAYKVDFKDNKESFDPPNWPKQTLGELISVTFAGRMIEVEDHPALARLRGLKTSIK